MRKTFNLLFICLIALYGWIGYQVIHTTDLPQCQPEGSLSDVAEEVIAIPLKTNGHCSLNKIKMIKRDREDIFLVSDRQLYHFNSSGQFLGQITAHLPGTRQPVELVDYAVDPVHDRLVVIGTGHEVYYYDYDGQLLFQSILPQDASWKTFGHMAYYNNHLWTTIDLVNSENKQAPSIEQWLYKFDLYFNEVGKRKLDVADFADTLYGSCYAGHFPRAALHLETKDGAVFHALLQIINGVIGFDLAVVDDDDAVADSTDLAQNVGTQDNGVVPPQIQDQVADFHQLCRVQTNGRFVEDQHLDVAQEHFQNLHALLHAHRDIADKGIRVHAQAVLFAQGHDLLAGLGFLQKAHFL